MIEGMLVSFSDSPDGFRGEWQEINHQFDISVFYRFNEAFGLRQKLTLFYQHSNNGYLRYLAAELGIHWGNLQLNLLYQLPDGNRVRVITSTVGAKIGYYWNRE